MSNTELMHRFRTDLEFYSLVALKIKTKDARLIPFRFNRPQRILHEFCEKMKQEVGYVRVVLLKFRQFGGSTYIGARGFHMTSTAPFVHGKVIAHTTQAVKDLFSMQDRFYRNLPEFMKPMIKYQGKTELYFANPSKDKKLVAENPGLDSSLSVYSARAIGPGRGSTLRFLHCSEVPQWNDPEETMLGLLNTVPSDEEAKKNTEVFLESTARGVGDYFYNMYYDAKNGKSDFRAIFLPWYLMDEYQRKVPLGVQFTAEERELMEKEHPEWEYINPATGAKTLSPEQVYWRRITIATECSNDVFKFRQEYPLTDDEAFVTSGKPYFNQDDVKRRLNFVRGNVKPIFVGEVDLPLEIGKDMLIAAKKMRHENIKFVSTPYGRLKIWREPRNDESYYFGADVSSGIRGGDRSVLDIYCRQDGFQVAQWLGYEEPDIFGFIIYVLGRHYNWAFGSPEANIHGVTTLTVLKDLFYPGIYRRLRYDQVSPEPTETEGWFTSGRTRPLMLDELKHDFREGVIQINSVDTLQEMLTFGISDTNNKLQAQDGCYDDCIMAAAIAAMMKREIREARPRKRTRIVAPRVMRNEYRDPYTGYS